MISVKDVLAHLIEEAGFRDYEFHRNISIAYGEDWHQFSHGVLFRINFTETGRVSIIRPATGPGKTVIQIDLREPGSIERVMEDLDLLGNIAVMSAHPIREKEV